MGKIAIHGFGRIGRTLQRIGLQRSLFTAAAVSDIKDAPTLAALFQVDTNYGVWPEPVDADDHGFRIGGRAIPYYNAQKELPPWGDLGIDVVVDCTGRATTRAGAQPHLDRGAKHVLVSAPSKSKDDCDAFILAGINTESYDPARHGIVSMASCTTNALAPVVKVLRDSFGIQYGLFSTVHAYTNSQSLTDQPMKDRRDSWAAAENIIPSSSGAAKSLGYIWPDLKVTGKAYRVPVRTGSIVELNVMTRKPATVEAVNNTFRQAASQPPLAGIMAVLEGEWPSARIVGDDHSSLVDLPLTMVQDECFLSVAAWYDNEWGFSVRLAEVAAMMGQRQAEKATA
jgi:glyceraldehyde 3-phosphate dehydrogenase